MASKAGHGYRAVTSSREAACLVDSTTVTQLTVTCDPRWNKQSHYDHPTATSPTRLRCFVSRANTQTSLLLFENDYFSCQPLTLDIHLSPVARCGRVLKPSFVVLRREVETKMERGQTGGQKLVAPCRTCSTLIKTGPRGKCCQLLSSARSPRLASAS